MPRGTDMDSVVIRGSSNTFRMSDVVNMLEYPTKNGKAGWVTIRLFGPVYSDAFFWAKAKQGSNKAFRAPCRCYDPDTHQCVPEKFDPWYDEYRRECDENVDRKERLLNYSRYFYMQAIVRKLQDNMPAKNRISASEKKTGFKDPDSDSYTPVVVVQLTPKVFKAIQDMKEDNIVKLKSGTRKAYNVSDEKFGRDIMLKKDTSAGVAPGDIYQVKLAVDSGRTPLTDEEKEYLTWDMNTIYAPEVSEAQVKQDFDSWARRMGLSKRKEVVVDDEDDDTDDFEETPTPKLKKKAKPKVEEDDFDDDSEDFDDDDEVEETPKKKKPSKKSHVEEDDDDFDEDDEDFEEDEKPAKKSKRKPVEEDEDDFDEDDFDEDDDDFDDEPPKKSTKKTTSKKKPKVEEDEDDFDDDDFDDDDEEETPKPAKKKPVKKVAKKSKRKPVEEDEDDFDDDDDDPVF